jgi:AAA family ATP:ADP antiporter
MPSMGIFMLLYVKASDRLTHEKLCYATLSPFIFFFGAFGFMIYPNLDVSHPTASTIAVWPSSCSKANDCPLAIVKN